MKIFKIVFFLLMFQLIYNNSFSVEQNLKFVDVDSLIENTLYHINLGDWVSWYLSKMNGVDAIEIDVIEFLKRELSKIS